MRALRSLSCWALFVGLLVSMMLATVAFAAGAAGDVPLAPHLVARACAAHREAPNARLVDALRDAQRALARGLDEGDAAATKVAVVRVNDLLERMPHVTFSVPVDVEGLAVMVDGRVVPNAALTKRFAIDPGNHRVAATGMVGGVPMAFEGTVDVAERASITVRIALTSQRR